MDARWKEGVFISFSRDSNEFVLWDAIDRKVTRARSVQRVSESKRWNADALVAVNQRPQDTLYRAAAQPIQRGANDDLFAERTAPEDEPPKTRATSIRDLKVTIEDLKRYSPTELGCERCEFYKVNGHMRGCSYKHSKVCRDRIKIELAKSSEGRARLARVQLRI